MLVAIAIPVFTAQLEKSRDATSISNIRAAYAEAQASYLSEVGSDSNVTVNKTAGKITSITVAKVHFAGVQSGFSDLETGLPANATWSLTAAQGGEAGDYTLTFTYDDNGVPTVTAAK
ncbi:MAG: hypothetical protein IJ089_06745 [Clostridia bacterium]|nr:hypothetical protein [Clostridia bacterium]